jgi:hypothetical protein
MSDDHDTLQIPALSDNGSDPRAENDETLTDEFKIDDDVRENEATRRLESSQLSSITSTAQSRAAVPGRNSTLPLPAVTASKTTTSPVPEAVLAAMRSQKPTTPDRPAIKGESIVKGESVVTSRPHEVLAEASVGSDDDTVDRSTPPGLIGQAEDDHSETEESFPTVSFMAEIDGDGRVFIPRQYMGMLRYGQTVEVQIQVVPMSES